MRGIIVSEDQDDNSMPSIVIVGIGGGGSRILSDGMDKIIKHRMVDRYHCLSKALRATSEEPHVFIVDTSADPTRKGFFKNIPEKQKISLSSTISGMSRGAGGRPGRAAKSVLNDEVVGNLTENLYKPISDIGPAIVVLIHTADGGTGGGLTPEILQHLGYILPLSTIFWVFTVFPRRNPLSLKGPRTVAPVMGKMLHIARRISKRDFTHIPFKCREVINNSIERGRVDQSYEFQHSRIAIFPLSNHHFAQCWEGFGRKEIREEVLNPFPIELLSQALYPFLKYNMANQKEQTWMQENWPLGPIDIPDIMAGLTPARPFVIPHLWIDPKVWDENEADRMIENLKAGKIELTKEDGSEEELDLFTMNGACAGLYEFRTTSIYCIPVYPEGSKFFDDFGDYVSDMWFPMLSGKLNYIFGKGGQKTGIISHAANLKPQPIPRPEEGIKLGFEEGIMVSLLFGAVPADLPIWLESTRDIIKGYKTEDFWEIEGYDAKEWLRELSAYIGWNDWPNQKYIDI